MEPTLILTLKQQKELVIDTVTQDHVLEAGFSEAARERAELLELVGAREELVRHLEELLGRADLEPSAPLEHLDRVLEVLHVRPEEHGLSKNRNVVFHRDHHIILIRDHQAVIAHIIGPDPVILRPGTVEIDLCQLFYRGAVVLAQLANRMQDKFFC